MPGAGALDRRIVIQRFTATPDTFNEGIKTWSDLITVWAAREDVSDGESVRAGELGAYRAVRFVIRYSSLVAGVNPKDRVSHDGVLFNIKGVKETRGGRDRFLELTTVREAD